MISLHACVQVRSTSMADNGVGKFPSMLMPTNASEVGDSLTYKYSHHNKVINLQLFEGAKQNPPRSTARSMSAWDSGQIE